MTHMDRDTYNRLKSQTNLQSSNIFKYTNLWTYDPNKQINFQTNLDRHSKFKQIQTYIQSSNIFKWIDV
jgi:alpha-acetolactate decarboxylase